MRDPRDLLDVEPRPVAVADGGDRDDSRLFVDRLLEALDRDPRAVRVHVHDLRAAQLLRVPDLADRRELEVADHDLRPRAKSTALASELTPADSDVVTATSSGSPLTRRANVARAVSVRSTQ